MDCRVKNWQTDQEARRRFSLVPAIASANEVNFFFHARLSQCNEGVIIGITLTACPCIKIVSRRDRFCNQTSAVRGKDIFFPTHPSVQSVSQPVIPMAVLVGNQVDPPLQTVAGFSVDTFMRQCREPPVGGHDWQNDWV